MMLKKTISTPSENAIELTTIIAAGTEINGKISSNGDVRIDGNFIGDIRTTCKVYVGENGKVQGDIHAQKADVMGKVNGNLHIAELLSLKANSEVKGNLYTGQLLVDSQASFNGECHMGKAEAMAQVVAIQQEVQSVSGHV
ncbi:MAG: polymer-forming cytoskeletal protein [Bacteroidota bacterium]|jgi:cytoskeletal protein CcmA (bactofilin family)